jgi:hypothetical protein
MLPRTRREVFLDHGRIVVELPRLTTDEHLADVLETSAIASLVRCKLFSE